MKAEIITIGDELLIGQVVDTNSAWIAEQLNAYGIQVQQITSIPDDRERIIAALSEATGRAELVLLTGGLGPTKDDITKQALCDFFDTQLVFNQEAYDNVERIFASRGLPVTELNRMQAYIPEGCKVLNNMNGTAPGMWFDQNGCITVSLPGVPFEMKSLVAEICLPLLAGMSEFTIMHRTIWTEGVGESFLAAKIAEWESNLPSCLSLAYLPQPGIVRLRLTARGKDKDSLKSALSQAEAELMPLIADSFFGFDEETLPMIIGKLLTDNGLTLSTAESCTGGSIAQMITSIPGSSEYFKGSVIAYSNEIKEKLLGVSLVTLVNYGAVSEETVLEMAIGGKTKLGTDFSVAVSGIAGPAGGTPEKPVGTTWIAVATPQRTVAKKLLFGEHRGRNIQRATIAALNFLRKELLLYLEKH